jgi:hypothetical protein
MEKVVRQYRSHRESERGDRAFYRSLSSQERLEILLGLINQGQGHEAEQGFARVYRIVKLRRS